MAAKVSVAPSRDPVKQFSVFAENRVGRLHDLTALLKAHNVHIIALTILDTTDSSVIRLLVDDPGKARELMANHDFPYNECEVLAVEITDESDFDRILAALLEAEINIHYVYAFLKRPEGRTALVLHIEDRDTATQALGHRNFRVLTQHDIAR